MDAPATYLQPNTSFTNYKVVTHGLESVDFLGNLYKLEDSVDDLYNLTQQPTTKKTFMGFNVTKSLKSQHQLTLKDIQAKVNYYLTDMQKKPPGFLTGRQLALVFNEASRINGKVQIISDVILSPKKDEKKLSKYEDYKRDEQPLLSPETGEQLIDPDTGHKYKFIATLLPFEEAEIEGLYVYAAYELFQHSLHMDLEMAIINSNTVPAFRKENLFRVFLRHVFLNSTTLSQDQKKALLSKENATDKLYKTAYLKSRSQVKVNDYNNYLDEFIGKARGFFNSKQNDPSIRELLLKDIGNIFDSPLDDKEDPFELPPEEVPSISPQEFSTSLPIVQED